MRDEVGCNEIAQEWEPESRASGDQRNLPKIWPHSGTQNSRNRGASMRTEPVGCRYGG